MNHEYTVGERIFVKKLKKPATVGRINMALGMVYFQVDGEDFFRYVTLLQLSYIEPLYPPNTFDMELLT